MLVIRDRLAAVGHRYGLVVVAMVLAVAGAGNATRYPSGPHAVAGVLSALTGGAVLLRRWSTLAMAIATAVGLALLAVVGIGETPMWAFVELLLVAFWTAADLRGPQAAAAAGLLLAAGIAFDARSGESGVAGSIVSPLVIIAAPAAAGLLLRRSREQSARLRELSGQLAEQRDRAAASAELAERARIAREIHDIVAHTVSVMLVQAGAAQDLLDPVHPASQPVGAIRATGKQALAELRRVIGVLRAVPPDEMHPQPTLADLAALVDTARTHGADVHLEISPALDDLAPGTQLTIYRTVQEALTNVRKHAAGAPATVRISRTGDRVLVTVDDEGSTVAATGAGGYGLTGLRERAELYDGELHAGPAPGGGWRVELQLPVDAQPAARREAAS